MESRNIIGRDIEMAACLQIAGHTWCNKCAVA